MEATHNWNPGVKGFGWASTTSCHNKQKESKGTFDRSSWIINYEERVKSWLAQSQRKRSNLCLIL